MTFRVLKPFNSVNRRFKPGDEISYSEDLSPLTVETAKAAGLIEPVRVEAAKAEPARKTIGTEPGVTFHE